MECCNVVELDFAMAGPGGWRDVILGVLVFGCGVGSEVFDPCNTTNVCLELRPKGDEKLDTLRKEHNVEECDPNVPSTQLTAQHHDEDDENSRNACDYKVQNQRQPSLYRKEEVEWALAAVEQILGLVLHKPLPAKRSNGRQTL